MLNVVILNGGRGAASIITAMLQRSLNVTSIVNAYDDGRSTGDVRRFFDMLGPSDIRKVQALMLPENDRYDPMRRLFAQRYPLSADRQAILTDLRCFAEGSSRVAGIDLAQDSVVASLQRFVAHFLSGLALIERARDKAFSFADCALLNCIYAGAFLTCHRDMELTTRTLEKLLRLRGTVLPNSIENKWLAALREGGEILYSEAEIVELRSNVRIESIYLLDQPLERSRFSSLSLQDQRHYLSWHHAAPVASAGVTLALEQADVIVYAAGTQHSSLYPTYITRGIADAIATNRNALKVFVTNIGADYETPSYTASQYVKGAYRYLAAADRREYRVPDLFSVILVNNGRRKADETYVEYDEEGFSDIPVDRLVTDFESEESPGKHDGRRVTETILDLHARSVAK